MAQSGHALGVSQRERVRHRAPSAWRIALFIVLTRELLFLPVSRRRAYDSATAPDRLFGGPDELDDWDAKTRASSWAAANRSFHLSLARSHSQSPAVKSPAPANDADVASIQSLLGQLALKQSQETAQLVHAFEERNKALWDSIEASIREAEKEEGERQRVLAEQRRKEEEAKRRAQELREAEEKRAREQEEMRKAQEKEEHAKAEAIRQRDEEERAKRAEEERKAAAKASALGLPGADAEGSPKSEFERWTAKMTVSPLDHSVRRVRPLPQ